MTTILHIEETGEAWAIASTSAGEYLRAVGAVRQGRASHVVPRHWAARALFRAIRALVRDDHRAAAWTRTWRCEWVVAIVGGPVMGPFADRAEAIAWEIEWLDNNWRIGDAKRVAGEVSADVD